MTTYLGDQVEENYKLELDNLKKQLKNVNDKYKEELSIIQLRIDVLENKIKTEAKILESKETEKLGNKIKYKGPTDKNQGLYEVLEYFKDDKKRFYYLTEYTSWPSLIKKEYPPYDIDNDIVECKKEIFNNHTHFTFFINGYAFYQIHSAMHECWSYYVDEIGSGIKKYISFKELEEKRIKRERKQYKKY